MHDLDSYGTKNEWFKWNTQWGDSAAFDTAREWLILTEQPHGQISWCGYIIIKKVDVQYASHLLRSSHVILSGAYDPQPSEPVQLELEAHIVAPEGTTLPEGSKYYAILHLWGTGIKGRAVNCGCILKLVRALAAVEAANKYILTWSEHKKCTHLWMDIVSVDQENPIVIRVAMSAMAYAYHCAEMTVVVPDEWNIHLSASRWMTRIWSMQEVFLCWTLPSCWTGPEQSLDSGIMPVEWGCYYFIDKFYTMVILIGDPAYVPLTYNMSEQEVKLHLMESFVRGGEDSCGISKESCERFVYHLTRLEYTLCACAFSGSILRAHLGLVSLVELYGKTLANHAEPAEQCSLTVDCESKIIQLWLKDSSDWMHVTISNGDLSSATLFTYNKNKPHIGNVTNLWTVSE
ncbi:hypothetical protein BC830DRAFT_1078249 [Chytriomyces sp. MP71]|nr:hypothetical protein BC830DRAFT_1078249 [Chytriomyces sp. MP71]